MTWVARAMSVLLLMRNHPPVIVFEDDWTAYFGALEAWDAERDLEPMKAFLKADVVRTWRLGTRGTGEFVPRLPLAVRVRQRANI